jgi:hypothetical protein
MTISDKAIPAGLAMKVVATALTYFFAMVIAMKILAPLMYGASATSAIISQTIAMMTPVFMIGMGFLALRAQTASLMNLLIHSLVMSILISGIMLAAGIRIYLNS